MEQWKRYQVDVPPGISGDWKIDRFIVSEADEELERIRSLYSSSSRGQIPVSAGKYTGLWNDGVIVMSDTQSEIRDHREFIDRAAGSVLIHGLGLGMAARACLLKPEVTDVTIVELECDVINLVGGWLESIAKKAGKGLTIICNNALTWKPVKGAFWQVVWHDIWTDISEDNLPSMCTLHRRFGRRCDWQGSWKRSYIEWVRLSIRG
jgi:hypothetical protein